MDIRRVGGWGWIAIFKSKVRATVPACRLDTAHHSSPDKPPHGVLLHLPSSHYSHKDLPGSRCYKHACQQHHQPGQRKLIGARGWKCACFGQPAQRHISGVSHVHLYTISDYLCHYSGAPTPATHAPNLMFETSVRCCLKPLRRTRKKGWSNVARETDPVHQDISDHDYRCYCSLLLHAPTEAIWLSAHGHHDCWRFSHTPFCCFLPETLVVLVKPFFNRKVLTIPYFCPIPVAVDSLLLLLLL